jgi:AraC-like DNA-binding protein
VRARTTKPRKFTHRHRQHLERAAEHYLRHCYRGKTRATVAEFASILECHPDYLTRTAGAILGASLLDYLRGKQLEEAARLITTTPLGMREVALRSGFGTTATFYRFFRAAHAMPPGAFRKVRK